MTNLPFIISLDIDILVSGGRGLSQGKFYVSTPLCSVSHTLVQDQSPNHVKESNDVLVIFYNFGLPEQSRCSNRISLEPTHLFFEKSCHFVLFKQRNVYSNKDCDQFSELAWSQCVTFQLLQERTGLPTFSSLQCPQAVCKNATQNTSNSTNQQQQWTKPSKDELKVETDAAVRLIAPMLNNTMESGDCWSRHGVCTYISLRDWQRWECNTRIRRLRYRERTTTVAAHE